MAFVAVVPLEKCREGGGTFVACRGRELAVFRLDGPERVIVIDNACPHANGNLSAGEVEVGVVTCPWHQWKFDLDTGRCTNSPRARVRRYPAELRDGVVWADLDGYVWDSSGWPDPP